MDHLLPDPPKRTLTVELSRLAQTLSPLGLCAGTDGLALPSGDGSNPRSAYLPQTRLIYSQVVLLHSSIPKSIVAIQTLLYSTSRMFSNVV